jgi:hypothetical protein
MPSSADKLCPEKKHRRLCLLPDGATCPGTGALVCPTTDGASACVYNATTDFECPPSDVLDATDFECPTKTPLACIQDVQTSSCPTIGGLLPDTCTTPDGTAFVCVCSIQRAAYSTCRILTPFPPNHLFIFLSTGAPRRA